MPLDRFSYRNRCRNTDADLSLPTRNAFKARSKQLQLPTTRTTRTRIRTVSDNRGTQWQSGLSDKLTNWQKCPKCDGQNSRLWHFWIVFQTLEKCVFKLNEWKNGGNNSMGTKGQGGMGYCCCCGCSAVEGGGIGAVGVAGALAATCRRPLNKLTNWKPAQSA